PRPAVALSATADPSEAPRLSSSADSGQPTSSAVAAIAAAHSAARASRSRRNPGPAGSDAPRTARRPSANAGCANHAARPAEAASGNPATRASTTPATTGIQRFSGDVSTGTGSGIGAPVPGQRIDIGPGRHLQVEALGHQVGADHVGVFAGQATPGSQRDFEHETQLAELVADRIGDAAEVVAAGEVD